LNILLTGGTGYIGSHAAVVLAQAGHTVVLFDNYCNSTSAVLPRLEQILGLPLPMVDGDVRNTALLVKTLQTHHIDAVLHFAGLKAVGESVAQPLRYFAANVQGAISLLQAMQLGTVRTLVFSSSATVYGNPQYLPFDEAHPTGAKNPYGRTKLHIEHMLHDLAASDPSWQIACLRYFNPVGAHPSGLIGEAPQGTPNNLMPYVAQVATGQRPHLNVFGNDYPTLDGTGVRDYIHVMDLAEGHLAALNFLSRHSPPPPSFPATTGDPPLPTNHHTFNLGTGTGTSVLQLLEAFEAASGKTIPYQIGSRRPGDLAAYYANAQLAKKVLGWQARRSLHDMCASTWHWQNEGPTA
jgi:UDP-glucose 4-epimerase